MGKVKDILASKGSVIYSVQPKTIVLKAIELMCEKNIGGLLIIEDNRLVGIFTERDYARKLILKGKSSKDTLIGEIMTPNPFTISTEATIEDSMKLMTEKHIRHLPVNDEDDNLVGMISIGDVVKYVIEEQKTIIEQLENYITH